MIGPSTLADRAVAPSPQARPVRRALRLTWGDGVIAAAIAVFLAFVVWRTNAVLDYRWDWRAVWPFVIKVDPKTRAWQANLILQGLFTTIRLAVWGILIAGIIGTVMGAMRASNRLLPRLIAGSYVMLIRNIPPVVFVFIFVFFIASQIMPSLEIGRAHV